MQTTPLDYSTWKLLYNQKQRVFIFSTRYFANMDSRTQPRRFTLHVPSTTLEAGRRLAVIQYGGNASRENRGFRANPSEAIVYVHGLTDSPVSPQAKAVLEGYGTTRPVFALALSAHWRSQGSFGFENFREDLATMLRHIRGQGIERVVLVGDSMGGLVTADFLSQHYRTSTPTDMPAVAGAVMRAPPKNLNELKSMREALSSINRARNARLPMPLVNVLSSLRGSKYEGSLPQKIARIARAMSAWRSMKIGYLRIRDFDEFARQVRRSPDFLEKVSSLHASGIPVHVLLGSKDNVVGTSGRTFRGRYKSALESSGVNVRVLPFAHSPPLEHKVKRGEMGVQALALEVQPIVEGLFTARTLRTGTRRQLRPAA